MKEIQTKLVRKLTSSEEFKKFEGF
jgi:hypothetical protein